MLRLASHSSNSFVRCLSPKPASHLLRLPCRKLPHMCMQYDAVQHVENAMVAKPETMSSVPTLQRESIRLYLLPGLEENDLPDERMEAAAFCPAAEHDAASASTSGPSGAPNSIANDNAATAQAAGVSTAEDGMTDDDTAAAHGTPAEDGTADDGTAAAQGGAVESSSNSQSGG